MMFGSEFWRQGRGRRFRRGMLRWIVLKVLDAGERHGYDFIRMLQERGWSGSSGSIYPLLASLETEGLVQGRDQNGKRVYTITDEGRRVLREEAPPRFDFEDIFESEAQGGEDELQGAFDRLGAAWAQAKHVAKAETLERIVAIVNQARKDIYSALADE